MKALILKVLREHAVDNFSVIDDRVIYESSFDDVADAIVKEMSADLAPDNLSDSIKLFKFLVDLKAQKNTGSQFKPGGMVNGNGIDATKAWFDESNELTASAPAQQTPPQ